MRALLKNTIFIGFLCFFGCTAEPSSGTHKTCPPPGELDKISLADLPEGIPLYTSLFANSIRAGVANGQIPESYSYHNYLQTGHYATVRKSTEEPLLWGLDTSTASTLARLDNYNLEEARTIILDSAANHQLTFITEAHTKPEHRVYTRLLLQGLHDLGYRHLGLESLMGFPQDDSGRPFDTTMQKRGYPLITPFSGLMTSEPEMGNLIRTAIDLGFQVFSYEKNGSSDSERDLQQAERLINYQQEHPGEKILCHGGWYHNIETPIAKPGGSHWMAYHYKKITGDDPLTIYQDALNEKIAENQRSSPYYEYIVKNMEFFSDLPHALVGKDSQLWKGPEENLPFDITLVYPPLPVEDGYGFWQDWSKEGGSGEVFNFNNTAYLSGPLEYPIILEVRMCSDSDLATPILCREFSDAAQNGKIYLPEGRYRITYKDHLNAQLVTSLEL